MNWGSLENFLHMGGHGPFVWGSYANTLVLMVAEPILAGRRHRAAVARGGVPGDEGAVR